MGRGAPIRSALFASTVDAAPKDGFPLPGPTAALASAASAVIFDLEDTTAESEKANVRARLADFAGLGDRVWVRINDINSETWREDVRAAVPAAAAIMVPKVNSSTDLDAIAALLTDLGSDAELIGLVETATGLVALDDICQNQSGRLRAVMLGIGDLTQDLGVTYSGMGEIENYARCKIVVASAAAGIAPPLDSASLFVNNAGFFTAEAQLAKTMGFGGKCCLALEEVAWTTQVFAPTAAEVQRARKIMDAYRAAQSEGQGILTFEGNLVDLPVVRRAASVLIEAGEPVAMP